MTHPGAKGLERRERFLQRLRIELHLLAGRREDRLLFDYQTALAERLGYTATPTRRVSERIDAGVFPDRQTVIQLNTILLQNIGTAIFPQPEQTPQEINARFQNTRQLLDVVSEEVFNETPSAILEAFLLLQQPPNSKA